MEPPAPLAPACPTEASDPCGCCPQDLALQQMDPRYGPSFDLTP